MPTISLCMIVKDEEQYIERCLASVRDFVKEMIIVDTGSSDRTKQICRELGAMVYDFRWLDHFAQARNFGLEKATGEWILWLDADEELCAPNFPVLRNALENCRDHLLPMQLIHLYGQAPADEHRSYRSTDFRLFRNGIGIAFVGAIHEKLDMSALAQPVQIEPTKHAYIRHYGYMDHYYQRKANRILPVLLKQREEHPDDPWLDYHLAAELHRANEPAKAYETVNRAIIGFLKKSTVPPALMYKLKYDILVATGSFDAAYPGIEKAIALYPDYVDLHFYKGRILYGKEQYDEAAAVFSYCLILGETRPQYLIMSGAGSFYALYYLGLCYEKQQKYEQASETYRQAIKLYPEFTQAKTRLYYLDEE